MILPSSRGAPRMCSCRCSHRKLTAVPVTRSIARHGTSNTKFPLSEDFGPMDRVSSKIRSRIMASVGSKNTKPELSLRRALHAAGIRYRLHVNGLPGKPDVIVPSRRLVIFVHGCFWHGCPRCTPIKQAKSNLDYWQVKIDRNRLRDRSVQRRLRREGWRVHIIWECDTRSLIKLAAFARRVNRLPRE